MTCGDQVMKARIGRGQDWRCGWSPRRKIDRGTVKGVGAFQTTKQPTEGAIHFASSE